MPRSVRQSPTGGRSDRERAFSLVELLVVIAVLSLLVAIVLPGLQVARKQAQSAMCAANLQQFGRALMEARGDTGFYPYWDDDGTPTRYTWIDVLVQNRYVTFTSGRFGAIGEDGLATGGASIRMGYCPSDNLPDPLNVARHPDLIYPRTGQLGGVDYSYGIGAPLSAGGWALGSSSRRFLESERGADGRVLATDAVETRIYNLSGNALETGIWNAPTQYDNTVAWQRHAVPGGVGGRVNVLYQDGHAAAVAYSPAEPHVNTGRTFVWHPGEALDVRPGQTSGASYYPDMPPSTFPQRMRPGWYTETGGWTLIPHK